MIGGLELEIGESDVSRDAVIRRGASIAVIAPIAPGEKQVVLTYLLPRNRTALTLPVDQATGELDFMVADTTATVVQGPLAALGITSFENTRFLRFEGRDVKPGAPVVIRLSRGPRTPEDFWWVVVAIAALALGATFAAWWRADRSRAGLTDAELLAAQVAVLDTAPAGAGDGERASRRAELMRRLAATLAERDSPS